MSPVFWYSLQLLCRESSSNIVCIRHRQFRLYSFPDVYGEMLSAFGNVFCFWRFLLLVEISSASSFWRCLLLSTTSGFSICFSRLRQIVYCVSDADSAYIVSYIDTQSHTLIHSLIHCSDRPLIDEGLWLIVTSKYTASFWPIDPFLPNDVCIHEFDALIRDAQFKRLRVVTLGAFTAFEDIWYDRP